MPSPLISMDTEFLSYGDAVLPLQVGYSRPVARRRQHTVVPGSNQIQDMLQDVYSDLQGGETKKVDDLYAMASGLKNVPTAAVMAEAIDRTRNASSSSEISGIAKWARGQMAGRKDTLTPVAAAKAREQFSGATVVGASIRAADMPIIRGQFGDAFADSLNVVDLQDYHENHPAVRVLQHLNAKTAPSGSGDFLADITAGFRSEIEPLVNTVLSARGIDTGALRWGSAHNLSRGTRSLADAYLLTGGMAAHSSAMADADYGGLGFLTPGGSHHGAGFDAALGASIGSAMGSMTDEEVAYGAQLLVAGRVYHAAEQAGKPMTETEAFQATAMHGQAIPKTKADRPGERQARAAVAAASDPHGDSGAFSLGSISEKISKHTAGVTDRLGQVKVPKGILNAKWGRAAVMGVGAAMAVGVGYQMKDMIPRRQSVSPSHIGSDRLAMAMALGG